MSELQILQEREILVYDNASAVFKIYKTSTTKWADVVELLKKDNLNISGKDAVLQSSKGHLVLPDAEIPEGNQKIFLVQTKQSSGATKITKAFKSMTFLELRRAATGMDGVGSNPTKEHLITLLEKSTGIKEVKSLKTKKEIVKVVKQKAVDNTPDLTQRVEAMEQILGDICSIFKKIGNKVKEVEVKEVKGVVKTESFNSNTTAEDLAKEAREISESLKSR